MSTDERQRVSRRIQSGFVYGVMALAAVVLIYLSVPRIVAYASILHVTGHIDPYLTKGTAIPAPLLDRAIWSYTKASNWQPRDAYLQQTLARLYMRRFGESELSSDARQAALARALERIDLSLAAAPNRHFSWTLRAEILRLMKRPLEEVVAALRMSYLLGAREASSMLMRVSITLDCWEKLPSEMHDIARKDLRGLWNTVLLRQKVASLYLRQSLVSRVRIRRFLLNTSEDAKTFDGYIRAVLRRR